VEPVAERVVLDTHALLWWLGGSDQLSSSAADAIESAGAVAVSSVTFWEVGMLVAKGRVALDRPIVAWTHDLVASGEVTDIAVDASIAARAAELEAFHGDPADRFISATAIRIGAPLVTRDRALSSWADESGQLRTIW
jgi:PIN domain nuclease of toxin-antitoxin system